MRKQPQISKAHRQGDTAGATRREDILAFPVPLLQAQRTIPGEHIQELFRYNSYYFFQFFDYLEIKYVNYSTRFLAPTFNFNKDDPFNL